MFKLNIYLFIPILNVMSLSKENLGKLKIFIKENNFVNNSNSSKNSLKTTNLPKVDDPSKIFYSIIDNSDNLDETSKESPLLKRSENSFHKINLRNTNQSNNLSIEDELYDEFNYLLDE